MKLHSALYPVYTTVKNYFKTDFIKIHVHKAHVVIIV